jgi:hypothetical protein
VLENKAGSFPLSFFFSLLFHQQLQKKRRRRGRGRTHVSSSTRERERERERAMEWNFRRRSIRSLFFFVGEIQKSSDFGVFQ